MVLPSSGPKSRRTSKRRKTEAGDSSEQVSGQRSSLNEACSSATSSSSKNHLVEIKTEVKVEPLEPLPNAVAAVAATESAAEVRTSLVKSENLNSVKTELVIAEVPSRGDVNSLEIKTEQNISEASKDESTKVHENGDDDDDDASCGICLCKMEPDEMLSKPSTCDHLFHYVCIMSWVNRGTAQTCPFCRRQITELYNPQKSAYESVSPQRKEAQTENSIYSYSFETQQSNPCFICGRDDRHDALMLCDGSSEEQECTRACHFDCLGLDQVPNGDWACPPCATGGRLLPAEISRQWIDRNIISSIEEAARLDTNEYSSHARKERLGQVFFALRHVISHGIHHTMRIDLLRGLSSWLLPSNEAGEEPIRFAVLLLLKDIFGEHMDFRLARNSRVGAALVRCINFEHESARNRELEGRIMSRIQDLSRENMRQGPNLPSRLVRLVHRLSSRQQRQLGNESQGSSNSQSRADNCQIKASLPSHVKSIHMDNGQDMKRALLYGSASSLGNQADKDITKSTTGVKPMTSDLNLVNPNQLETTRGAPSFGPLERMKILKDSVYALMSQAADALQDQGKFVQLSPELKSKIIDKARVEFMSDSRHKSVFDHALSADEFRAVFSSLHDNPSKLVSRILSVFDRLLEMRVKSTLSFVIRGECS
mmetsp:Transcript_2009/g.4526  ORF Transcript_2009/g.4526 Transcript_2009/m.4526 type:complete len:654 (+) Transcript_2009:137-2098(+)|eukprot:CAMPEP_0171547472 /NCGR_PEP_ID=MMETSP0960-20121227/5232_1 /TAXON_ID=87120 /ORGANISM="Aurantiochytrium limacinum, Strain ATCCMYA-1381" /LENGTH=653 /DNA_ID=CAMNT_0012095709 /DNA_START=53 /DNA_END=2014 /DNA_ORIENTATION=-